MKDQNKSCLGVFSFIAGFVISAIAFVIGWVGWEFKIGLIAGGVTFALFFLISGGLLATLSDPTAFTASLPFIFGSTYSVLPNFFPGPIDDATVFVAGVISSFALWLRRMPDMPKWTIFPLLTAGVYTLVGALIPGPVDELFVYILAGGTSGVGILQHYRVLKANNLSPDDIVEGEFTEA